MIQRPVAPSKGLGICHRHFLETVNRCMTMMQNKRLINAKHRSALLDLHLLQIASFIESRQCPIHPKSHMIDSTPVN